jgi:hypothetical protein
MTLDIEFFDANEYDKNIKCSIHKSGKIGFSGNAIEKLHIGENKSVSIGSNKEDEGYDVLYMKINKDEVDGAFSINKAGEYYYINTKNLFDKLGIDYRKEKIIFDIVKLENENSDENIYKLIKRVIGRRQDK